MQRGMLSEEPAAAGDLQAIQLAHGRCAKLRRVIGNVGVVTDLRLRCMVSSEEALLIRTLQLLMETPLERMVIMRQAGVEGDSFMARS